MATNLARPEIWFAGDCHGQFSHILETAYKHRPNAIVLLGDLDCPTPLQQELRDLAADVEVAYIPGNHDSDSEANWDNLTESGFVNLHGAVVTVAGVRIAGLGGVFRKPWYPRLQTHFDPEFSGEAYAKTLGRGNLFRGGLPLRHRTTIFPADLFCLSRQSADILVTHEAPGMHACGFDVITQLGQSMGVKKAFHGHLHDFICYLSSPWMGVGYRGIVDLDGKVIYASPDE
ncbi:metallophosphoesterase [Duganella sp. BJB476]|uniref:metallophosphoesterase family protein n=1 Tax=Duganella sp. BJB476 TaxID=1871176 RepID=UPI000E34D2AE|nr:metallophosphoesterase [Duganella sp. BJB476]RFP28723.1 metallophosphoesterase [Duganella sp. BJB476]